MRNRGEQRHERRDHPEHERRLVGKQWKHQQHGLCSIDWAGEVETTLRAMLGLPAQILTTVLPDETVQHLKAAGREGLLAAYSLWRNVDKSINNQSGEKVRKRIEVE